jgi:hypothetical protein
MRLGLLVFALAACSSSASAGPAWPRSTPREVDGGESLAPRAAARTVAAVVEKDDDDEPPTVVPDKPAAAPPVVDKPAAAATPAVPSADEVIMIEEIVIEIED